MTIPLPFEAKRARHLKRRAKREAQAATLPPPSLGPQLCDSCHWHGIRDGVWDCWVPYAGSLTDADGKPTKKPKGNGVRGSKAQETCDIMEGRYAAWVKRYRPASFMGKSTRGRPLRGAPPCPRHGKLKGGAS